MRTLFLALLIIVPVACQKTESASTAPQPTAAVSAIAQGIVGRSFKGVMRSHGYTLPTTVEFLSGSEYRANDEWESWRGTWRSEGNKICLDSTYHDGCYVASLSADGNSLYLSCSKFISGLHAES